MATPSLKRVPLAKTTALIKNADVAGVGLEMGAAIVVGYLLGSWVDAEFGIAPAGVIFFSLAGAGAAVKAIMRLIRQWRRQIDADKADMLRLRQEMS